MFELRKSLEIKCKHVTILKFINILLQAIVETFVEVLSEPSLNYYLSLVFTVKEITVLEND